MFSRLKRAWAVWVLAAQSFSSMLDGSFGYDKQKGTTSQKITNKRESFTIDLSIRMQNVQVECTDALRVIRSRDFAKAFHYCDPPYFNSQNRYIENLDFKKFINFLAIKSLTLILDS